MSDGIRNIVVAGSGSVAWIVAAGFARAFRAHALGVRLVETQAEPTPVGWWTLPSQRGIHALLGINEPHFLAHTQSTFRLGTEHRGWQGEGSAFLHAHGDIGVDLEGTPFYKYLQREAAAGRSANAAAFSVAGSAARLGKFARPMAGDLTASFTYGFHVDESRYSRYLREHALRLGVVEAKAPLAEVVRSENGDIRHLRLADDSIEAADLFLDCSGPEARLMQPESAGDREDWSAWLPCDRMISGRVGGAGGDAALTRTQAASAGWMWRAPLADSVMAGHVYSSSSSGEAAAIEELKRWSPAFGDDIVTTRLRAGRRRECWAGNCVALGAAAMELEPLAGAHLHFVQLGLATLVELFPLRRGSRSEAREFNRLIGEHADSLRDFTLAHYLAGAARPGEFWESMRRAAPPPALADRLDLYRASGRLVMRDHEVFEETDWAWLLIGTGCVPDAMEVQTRDRLDRLPVRDVDAISARVKQLAESMPSHAEYLRHQAAPPPR